MCVRYEQHSAYSQLSVKSAFNLNTRKIERFPKEGVRTKGQLKKNIICIRQKWRACSIE